MKHQFTRVGSLVAVVLSILFLNAGPFPSSYPAAVIPPVPANLRDVTLVHSLAYQYPYAPPLRTSADGRVGLSVKELANNQLQMYLFVPEAIDAAGTPFPMTARPTSAPLILPVTAPVTMSDSNFGPATIAGFKSSQQHHTFCDGTVQVYPETSASTNPYTSNTDSTCPPGVDCYKLWVISPVTYQDSNSVSYLTLYGTQIVVQVANPKTTTAQISSVKVVPGSQVSGPTFKGLKQFLEIMVTADGNLIVGRVQGSPLTWTDSSITPPSQVKGNYNIVYSVASPGTNPCDVRNWKSFFPIAHAPYDPNMNGGRYGLADYPFRDSENNVLSNQPDANGLIREQADIEGTYPWMDRFGRNLFFESVNAGLFNPNGTGVLTRYPDSCVGSMNCTDPALASDIPNIEEISITRGVTVAGRWTHGKMVQLDALVNNIDYGLFLPDIDQRMVSLYQNNYAVQLGSGRSNGGVANPTDYASNTTILDSFENLFTYLPTFQPIALREVVWQLNMGKGGDEVAFDDYLNPEALIISEMTASTAFKSYKLPAGSPASTYNDGFSQSSGFTQPIHLQNAATAVSSQWNIPSYGAVTGSNGSTTNVSARIEPAALGGIKGKGFWLQSGNYVSYSIPAQPQSVLNSPWFVSLFADIRTPNGQDDGVVRRILTFPDGTQVNIKGLSQLQIAYLQNGQQQTVHISLLTQSTPLSLPSPGWWHLAFQVAPGGTSVGVYVNGFLLTTISSGTQPIFQLVPRAGGTGALALGGDPADAVAGFNGWIDEFKVIAQTVDPETICNHARGTLVGLTSSSDSKWIQIANSYPTNPVIAQLSGTSYPQYACYHDYSSDLNAAYVNSPEMINGKLNSVRTAIHFPQALVWNQPRPDETTNAFCNSCHTDNGGQFSVTLTTAALVGGGSTPMWQDARRQPMHPQRLIFGHIPQNFINHQFPTSPQIAPVSGTSLDQWVFP